MDKDKTNSVKPCKKIIIKSILQNVLIYLIKNLTVT